MMQPLKILAGPSAFRQIREQGLSPDDVSAVFGASGAAKWLAIYGLDRAIFSHWLPQGKRTVDLFGTSVGAFKLAAAAMDNPGEALFRLADAYIAQSYGDDFSVEAVDRETKTILYALLGDSGVEEILANTRWRFHCGAVWSRGWLGRENIYAQRLALVKAFLLSVLGRRAHRRMFGRAVFGMSDRLAHFGGADGFETRCVSLTPQNLERALLASGSIPVAMKGVGHIDGAGDYIYRDGGLLDYHPVPANIMARTTGIVLYPHFYSRVIEGWFDKFYRRRHASAAQLDNVVIVAPSEAFIQSLPQSRIPDRKDFYTYKGRDLLRQACWREVMERSEELGQAWLDLMAGGKVAGSVHPL